MKKKTFYIVILLLLILFPIIKLFYENSQHGFKTDWEKHKEYRKFFKDSVLVDIDTLGYSYIGKNSVFNNFHYKSNLSKHDFGFNVCIWAFYKVNDNFKIDDIEVKKRMVEDVVFESGQILDKGSDLEVDVRDGFSFNSGLSIIIDESDSIISYYDNEKYKGCYGKFNRIVLRDGRNENQIVFYNYLNSKLTSIIFTKKGSNLIMFLIQSEKYFESEIINILKLD